MASSLATGCPLPSASILSTSIGGDQSTSMRPTSRDPHVSSPTRYAAPSTMTHSGTPQHSQSPGTSWSCGNFTIPARPRLSVVGNQSRKLRKSTLVSYKPAQKPISRDWTAHAVRRIEADYNRSADTHLIPIDLPALADIALYLKDEYSHPTGSLKHRLARSLFLYALCNGWIGEGIGRARVEPSFIPGVIDRMISVSDVASIAAARVLSRRLVVASADRPAPTFGPAPCSPPRWPPLESAVRSSRSCATTATATARPISMTTGLRLRASISRRMRLG